MTVILSNVYLFYVSFAGLGLGLEGLVLVLVLALLVSTTRLPAVTFPALERHQPWSVYSVTIYTARKTEHACV